MTLRCHPGYCPLDRLLTATTWSDKSDTSNSKLLTRVTRVYDGWRNLTTEKQWQTYDAQDQDYFKYKKQVQYAYTYSSGSNYLRPNTMTYPTGSRALTYGYGDSGAGDGTSPKISYLITRPDRLTWDSTQVSVYWMNGDGRLQFRQYWKGTGEQDLIAYAGYEYDGYERLNKIDAVNAAEDQFFEFRRTYDAKDNPEDTLFQHKQDRSEVYETDGLNRLSRFRRGTLDGEGGLTATVYKQSTGDTVGEYYYDALGRRVRKTGTGSEAVARCLSPFSARRTNKPTAKGKGTVPFSLREKGTVPSGTRLFYYDGMRVIEEGELDESDDYVATHQYVWGLRYLDELLVYDFDADGDGDFDSIGNGDLRGYTFQDFIYSTVAVMTPDGAVTERYDYTPYGGVNIWTGDYSDTRAETAVHLDFLFTGQMYDGETGLHHYKGRALHPPLGRFIQRDPVDDPAVGNAYLYASAAPTERLDPLGETDCDADHIKFRERCHEHKGYPAHHWCLIAAMTWRNACEDGSEVQWAAAYAKWDEGPHGTARTGYRQNRENALEAAWLGPRRRQVKRATKSIRKFADHAATGLEITGRCIPVYGLATDIAALAEGVDAYDPHHTPLAKDEIAVRAILMAAGAVAATPGPARIGHATNAARGLPDDVVSAFERGHIHAVRLKTDVMVVRVWGGSSKKASRELGKWLTRAKHAPTRALAKPNLQLPKTNAATWISDMRIPKGTRVYVGKVKGGNAVQFYVSDADNLIVGARRRLQ